MTRLRFLIKSLLHYAPDNLALAAGIAISTAVLTGALIIGDSVRFSLEENVRYRLGKTSILIDAGERFVTVSLAQSLQSYLEVPCVPVLQTGAMAIVDGGRIRENNIQVQGVDSLFDRLIWSGPVYKTLSGDKVIISHNLAGRLQVREGDPFSLRIKKNSLIPLNAPFVSDEETTVTMRVTVSHIAGEDELGMFNLRNSQTAPANVFISLETLNRLLETEGKANRILVAAGDHLQKEEIEAALGKLWNPLDAGLKTRYIPGTGELEIYSERVFIEPAISDALTVLEGNKRYIFSYFVNSIKTGNKETPYSFVSSPGDGQMKDNQVLVNEWLAEDLSLHEGDSIEMTYYIIGPLRTLEERSVTLCVKDIIPISGVLGDPNLMPWLPGLADAGNCRDWEAGVPIDLERIRTKDEEYWNTLKGTPKAFIAADLAQDLWQNRFGNYTAIRIREGDTGEKDILSTFREHLHPSDLGIIVSSIRKDASMAAHNGVNFGQLFLGLTFFVLLSAMLLTSMLFLLTIESRLTQAGTLSALGFSHRLIRKLFILEGMFVSFTGVVLGTLLAILYNKGILLMLNRLWYDIVRTTMLEMKINPLTVLIGSVISFCLGWLVIWITLQRKFKRQTIDIQRDINTPARQWITRLIKPITLVTLLISSGILLFMIISNNITTAGSFIAGTLLLAVCLAICYLLLRPADKSGRLMTRMYELSLRNMSRNHSRSYAIILLFSLGTFIIVSTGANRKDLSHDAHDPSSGTGGFTYFASSTVPVLHDLNDPEAARAYGLEGKYSFVQFFRSEGDDASCLNLNRVTNPFILGTDPRQMDGRFMFITGTEQLSPGHPWLSLKDTLPGGVVPAIADQTAIQWGLGMKTGDTLVYRNASGDTMKLKLIGGLAASVFQGNVIISDNNFLNHFPATSGSSVFLIDSQSGNDSLDMADFNRAFRDYGWQMTKASDRLAEFYSVENTYLSIFLLLGILSLVLGTAGLGILLARSIMERRGETGIMQAVGYSRMQISGIIFTEYFILLTAGILSGFIPALIATLPSLLSLNTDVSAGNLIMLLLFLLVNSVLWIGLFTRFSTGANLIRNLRYE